MAEHARPITVLVCALGGEGGGVLSQWLFDTALACGHSAQSTSIPGVAQRTGATTYYVEVYPRPDRELGARRPVFGLSPVPGAIDLLLSSELLETVRQVGLGMASAERTTVIASSTRALTVAEKMQPGDGRVGDVALLAAVQRHARCCEVLDLAALARDAGTVTSAVLLGAAAASGVLPFDRAAFEATIRRGGKGVEASLRGFALAYDAVAARRAQRAAAQQVLAAALAPPAGAPALPDALRAAFPPPVHEVLALGHARLVDYQDADYAELYVQRLRRIHAAELAADAHGTNGAALTRETARWLALWMAFDDVVRVAQLKSRAARIARVRSEVGAGDDDIVRVYDHFKPGVAEFAALLPRAWAERLQRWDARRRAGGREPWALALKVGAHTVAGALALRVVAALRRQRRRGSRFAVEQALIERWLAAVERGAGEHWPLGHELARCGRLIKGYGSTNERGKQRLLHIVDHVALLPRPPAERAAAVRNARDAALADEGGLAFDRTLTALGAPPRPPAVQPLHFHRRRPPVSTR